jgi:hypothetical protein
VDDLSRDRDAPGNGASVERVRVLPFVLIKLRRAPVADGKPQVIPLGEVHLAVFGVAYTHRGFDERVEDGVQSFSPPDRLQDVDERLLLLAQVLVVARNVFNVHCLALAHARDFTA